jgi:hypothetical protein
VPPLAAQAQIPAGVCSANFLDLADVISTKLFRV